MDSTRWLLDELEQIREIVGPDFQAHGLEPNRTMIQTFCDELAAQAVIARLVTVEEVFRVIRAHPHRVGTDTALPCRTMISTLECALSIDHLVTTADCTPADVLLVITHCGLVVTRRSRTLERRTAEGSPGIMMSG